MTQSSASGKAILFGEHAVVYDQPALAVPLSNLRTTVDIQPIEAEPGKIRVVAGDLHQTFWLHERDERDPLALVIRLTLAEIEVSSPGSMEINISSGIPIASGLGSGAAASVAIIRALSRHLDVLIEDERISTLAFEVEKLHHGTPSGIDNSVIALEQPLYFRRGHPAKPISLGRPLQLVLGHCGVSCPTGDVVRAVRERWQKDPEGYTAMFKRIGSLVDQATQALAAGELDQVGALMDSNHTQLKQMGVSIDRLDALVEAARSAGAHGAKLSGAGAGGFMIALVESETMDAVIRALQNVDAHPVLSARVNG